MQVQWVGRLAAGEDLLDVDIRDLAFAALPDGPFLYAGTGRNGGITAYRVTADSAASLHDRVYFPGDAPAAAAGMLELLDLPGGPLLLTGAAAGGLLAGYGLTGSGRFGDLEAAGRLLPGSGPPSALLGVALGEARALYVADTAPGRVVAYLPEGSSYRAAGAEGRMSLDGPRALAAARIGGQDFLLVAETEASRIVSYRISPETGALLPAGMVGAETGLGIWQPTALETVSAFGTTFVLAAAAGSSSVAVLRLAADGTMEVADHVLDTAVTRFGQVQSLSVLQSEGWVFVVAGGGDGGLSLFTLLPDGRLLSLQNLAFEAGQDIGNVTALAAIGAGEAGQIFVAGEGAPGLGQFSLPLVGLGGVIRGRGSLFGGAGGDLIALSGPDGSASGGGGDDILVAAGSNADLRGGDGADRFVLGAASGTVRIRDFEPGRDRLDLSDVPWLRNPAQIEARETATGIRLSYRDTVIVVTSATAAPLTLADIFAERFDWADRSLPVVGEFPDPEPEPEDDPAPPPVPGRVLRGGDGADRLTGGEGNDTLIGLGGDDRLSGMGGDDAIWGAAGADTLEGGAGSDTLGGFIGDDSLLGGDGADEIWGHDGADFARGGAGDDLMGGGEGSDTFLGGPGDDRVNGGEASDGLWGEEGNDTLGGYVGDDRMGGGPGDDVIWGNTGNDTAWGGEGDDFLAGFDGDDELYGGDGADTLRGGQGDDRLDGGDGDDRLGGYLGDDLLYGGDGDDELWGNAGSDLGWGGEGNDRLGGGTGSDTLRGEAGNDVVWGGDAGDSLMGGDGDDTVGGFTGDDSLKGGDGNDSIWGNIGDDSGRGGEGDDLLAGFDGNDTLDGEAGEDELRGGRGDDLLHGGDGADLFVFAGNIGIDRVADFEPGLDRIRIGTPDLGPGDLMMSRSDGDVIIDLPGGRIILDGLADDGISPSGFLDAGHVLFG